jgi:hypothetical protein
MEDLLIQFGNPFLKSNCRQEMEINYIGRDGFNLTQSDLEINEIIP